MNRKERVPTIEEFGAKLLETGDLDPLYIALDRSPSMKADRAMLHRWLFAYWCCYNAGASSFIAEADGDQFWTRMLTMARNDAPAPTGGRWPRGHERRHFRGEKAWMAIESYATRFPIPEGIVHWFSGGVAPIPYRTLRDRVTTLPQFGPWIAFKVADMLERVAGVPVSFEHADGMMFDQPYKSALSVFANDWKMATTDSNDAIVRFVAGKLLDKFSIGWTAPPRHDRAVNIQEVETILCKWKSHNTGHYPVGIDSEELRAGLEEWSKVSHLAHELYHFAPGVA